MTQRVSWAELRDESGLGQLLIVFELKKIERLLADIGQSEVNLPRASDLPC
jgi:hypothetical protein